MASKKKRTRPRPPSGSRSAPRPPAATAKPATGKPAGARGPTRTERLAAAEKARRRKAQRTRALVAGALVAVVTLITVTVISSRRSNDRIVSRLEAGSCEHDTKTDVDRGAGRNHLPGDIRYDTDPPSGGDHNVTATQPGVYTAQNTPPDSQIVHALEHGYIALWHRPDIAPADLEQLKGLAGRYDRDVLVVPRASLTQPVAATAWHRRLLCPGPDLDALELFVTTYRNKGPEDVPH